jgi:uncharacterized membrane protein
LISRFTGLDGIPIFKIVIPVLLGFVPLAMYELIRRFAGRKIALVSAFLLIFHYSFFFTMVAAARGELGWFFMAVAMLALVSEQNTRTRALAVVFFLAMVTMHYYTSYLAIMLLVMGAIVLALRRHRDRLVTVNIMLLIVVGTIGWYMNLARSMNFNVMVELVRDFTTGLSSGFSEFGTSYTAHIAGREELTEARLILKYLYLILQAFLAVGFAAYFWRWLRRRPVEFPEQFMAFAVASFALFAGTVVLPNLSAFIDINRAFSMTSIFLFPFTVIGIVTIIAFVNKARLALTGERNKREKESSEVEAGLTSQSGLPMSNAMPKRIGLAFMAIFVAIFFLFGNGFVSEVVGDKYPISYALSRDKTHISGFSEPELVGARWLVDDRNDDAGIYCDFATEALFYNLADVAKQVSAGEILYSYPEYDTGMIWNEFTPSFYIYLSGINIRSGELMIADVVAPTVLQPRPALIEDIPLLNEVIGDGNLIYANGSCKVFFAHGVASLMERATEVAGDV